METKTENPVAYEIKHWEFMALWLEAVLLGAAVLVVLTLLGRKLAGSILSLPGFVWLGMGLVLMGIVLYPVLSIRERNTYGRKLTLGKMMMGSLAGAVLGSLIYALLS